MTREEQMLEAVEQEHGKLSQRELYVTLTAMEWADENKTIDWRQVRIQAAITAMQTLIYSLRNLGLSHKDIANLSVNQADTLVKELKGE